MSHKLIPASQTCQPLTIHAITFVMLTIILYKAYTIYTLDMFIRLTSITSICTDPIMNNMRYMQNIINM